MPDGISIERLRREDIEEIAPLWKALLDHVAALPDAIVPVRPSDESWELERAQMLAALAGDAFVLVARRDGAAVGYVFVLIEGPDPVWYTGDSHAELAHLSVAPGERGAGVGTALMDAMDAELERLGVEDVEIGVDTGNDVAARLYESRGYKPDFRIFYGSPGKKPWACLRREAADQRAGRGRFAPPGPAATAAQPAAAGASTRDLRRGTGGADEARAGAPAAEPPLIELLPAADLDLLGPLWRVLQDDQARRWDVLPARDPADSWALRRQRYADWLATTDSFVLVARRDERLVGYFMVAVAEGDETFDTGELLAELESLVVLPEERGAHLGELFFQAGMRRLEELGVEHVVCGLLVTNPFIRRFCERHGFVPFVDFMYARRADIQAAERKDA